MKPSEVLAEPADLVLHTLALLEEAGDLDPERE